MDAPFLCRAGMLLLLLFSAMGANYATANFTVNAPTADAARQYAEVAEQSRKDLAILWLGEPLPDWSAKCPIKVHVGKDLGAGGSTSFVFENGEVFDWEMEIQGSHERILDSVMPHEITHMILASHFGKPIPRWLDEGIATSVECLSEKANYRKMLRHYLQSDVRRCFPLNRMVAMKDYPSDPMPFYAQGFSLVEYLLECGQRFDDQQHRRLVRFAESAMQNGDWQSALQEHYGIQNLGALQISWVAWVGTGNRTLPVMTEVPDAALPDLQAPANVPVVLISAKPLPPPVGLSVYDRQVETIPVKWNDEQPAQIPVSYGRNVVLR